MFITDHIGVSITIKQIIKTKKKSETNLHENQSNFHFLKSQTEQWNQLLHTTTCHQNRKPKPTLIRRIRERWHARTHLKKRRHRNANWDWNEEEATRVLWRILESGGRRFLLRSERVWKLTLCGACSAKHGWERRGFYTVSCSLLLNEFSITQLILFWPN